MNKKIVNTYVCPYTGQELTLKSTKDNEEEIIIGELINKNGDSFPIEDSILDITWPKELAIVDEDTRQMYDNLAEEYDKFANIPFKTFKCDNEVIRREITQKLNIKETDTVLEIGGGDGRGAEYIVKELNEKGSLYFQELSLPFLRKAQERLKTSNASIHYSLANASYLAFPDNFFDAAHHFGGLSTFSEPGRSLKELARVVKPGGKIVVGDESMAPWLRDTQMGKIMMNSNPLLRYDIPYELIPVEARNVNVEWIMMGAYFILEFEVGVGEPEPDFFVPIPSKRGGNHWVRYNGHLEGVTDETKKVAYKAQEVSGKSMHEWLDYVVKKAAKDELDK